MSDSPTLECSPSHPDFFKFVAQDAGTVTENDPSIVHTKSHCFTGPTTITLKANDENRDSFTVNIKTTGSKKSTLCSDFYLLQIGDMLQPHILFFAGDHEYTFKSLTDFDKSYVEKVGMKPFLFCDSVVNILPDVLKTVGLFLGGIGVIPSPNIPFFGLKPWVMQKKWNVEFIKKSMGFQWQEREKTSVHIPDKRFIRSGDYFAVTRFDGLDQIIGYGTGSRSGHSVVAMREGDEVYIVESQDAWYWPDKHGLQRTQYDEWMQRGQNADFNVIHMPLKKELADIMDQNEAKVWEYFNSVKGMPYGYHNFLFSWIDTEYKNFPKILDIDFVLEAFALIEVISPYVGGLLMRPALNKRLQVKTSAATMPNFTMRELMVEIPKAGFKVTELLAHVEDDSWLYPADELYPEKDYVQLVCSCFVAMIWKQGGLFKGMEINAAEFTPRDVYTINFYDEGPSDKNGRFYDKVDGKEYGECLKNEPKLDKYCQFFGEYVMDFVSQGGAYNTVAPYSHMNEKCESIGPDYARTPENC